MVGSDMSESTEVWRLVGSSAQLVAHLSSCEFCRQSGTRYCGEITELMEVVRADRRRIATPLTFVMTGARGL
jgi:hypothetical protein